MTWPPRIFAITLFTEDLDASVEWYRRAFDTKESFTDPHSAVFDFDGVMINLLKVEQADELVSPAVVGKADAGVRSQMTLPVEGIDDRCAELTARGIELLNGPQDRPWGIRTAAFSDPSGHVWEFAE